MPGPVAGYVQKGSFMRKLDLTLNVHGTREKLLDRFKSKKLDGEWTESILDITSEMLPLDADEREHIARHWFDPYRSWWPKQQPVDIILRLGTIQAIELANGPGPDGRARRIDCYWMNGMDDVRVTACVSAAQVTVIVFTPSIPLSDRLLENYTDATETEPIYTVRHRSRGPGERQVSLDEEFCELVQPLIPKEIR